MKIDTARPVEQIYEQLERVNSRFPAQAIPLDRLEDEVVAGNIQVFPVGDSSVYVCELLGDVAHIMAAAGDLRELLEAEPFVCKWYREHGATEIVLRGRCGWRRTLADMGWRPTDSEFHELRKKLDG